VVLEACGASHHWGRRLTALGHRVRLLPAQLQAVQEEQLLLVPLLLVVQEQLLLLNRL